MGMGNMIAYHLGRLQHKSAAVRLEAIRELSEIGDSQALAVLEALYRTESDVDVKQAAQAAGIAIYNRNRENEGT